MKTTSLAYLELTSIPDFLIIILSGLVTFALLWTVHSIWESRFVRCKNCRELINPGGEYCPKCDEIVA